MLLSQRLAVAAHLHVLLRRKTGRVTDTEWMAQNLEYALEVIRYSRAKATEEGHPELAEWAGKLEVAVLSQAAAPRPPLAEKAMQMLRERQAGQAEPHFADSTQSMRASDSGFTHPPVDVAGHPAEGLDGSRYVGGIR